MYLYTAHIPIRFMAANNSFLVMVTTNFVYEVCVLRCVLGWVPAEERLKDMLGSAKRCLL